MANWHLRLIAKATYVIAQAIDCKTDVKKFTVIILLLCRYMYHYKYSFLHSPDSIAIYFSVNLVYTVAY